MTRLSQHFISTLQCYTLRTSMKPVTFKYANDDCQSLRGTLISIADQVEQGGCFALLATFINQNIISD